MKGAHGGNRVSNRVSIRCQPLGKCHDLWRNARATACAAVLQVIYATYTVDLRKSTQLSSRDSHITFPTYITVNIVRGSILFIFMNSW